MKEETKHRIEVEDFDNAVKQPWKAETCILNQANKRINGEYNCYFFINAVTRSGLVSNAAHAFDQHFKVPGDEKKPELRALRASLPMKL